MPDRILYIAGVGRSGSTLLSSLLDAGDGMVAVGELQRIAEREHTCACGTPGRACVFWGPVFTDLGDVLPEWDPVAQQLLTKRLLPFAVTGHVPLARLGRRDAALQRYRELVPRLYGSVWEQAPGTVLVDKSSSPYWLSALLSWGGAEVHVVHLTRDPRAVAYSLIRPKWDEGKQQPMFTASPAWSSRFYLGQHSLVEVVKRRATSYRYARYEDLVADPVQVVGEIREQLGLVGDCGFEVIDDTVHLPPSHILDANTSRFDQGDVGIRIDDAWRTELPTRDRRLVETMTAPLLVGYGYGRTRRAVRR